MSYKTFKQVLVLQKDKGMNTLVSSKHLDVCVRTEKFNIPQKVGVNWSYQQNWLLHNSIGFSSATFTLFTSNLLLQASQKLLDKRKQPVHIPLAL